MRQKVLYSETNRDCLDRFSGTRIRMLYCSQIEKPHNHNFSFCSRASTERKTLGRTILTLGGSVMQTASEVGCEVLQTGQMTFLSGLFRCYCESRGLDTAAENK